MALELLVCVAGNDSSEPESDAIHIASWFIHQREDRRDPLPSDTHHANLGPVGGTVEPGLHSGAWVIPISQVVYSTACGSDRVALNNLYQKANNQLVKYTYTLPAGVAARSVCKGFC